MNDSVITQLNWDSDFFKMKVGRLDVSEDQVDDVGYFLWQCKSLGFELIYCFLPPTCYLSDDILKYWNGKLVDRKITYSLKSFSSEDEISTVEIIADDCSTKDYIELVNLAKMSGEFSRFKRDSGFQPGSFDRLYSHWLLQSLKGVIADYVFVQRYKSLIAGMMTFKENLGKGTIGLIGVAPDFQGQGIGKIMINNLKSICIQKGLRQIDVSTQELNTGACTFYIRNGFQMSSIVNIYHFWKK